MKELEQKKVDFGGISHEKKLGMMISTAYTTASYLKERGLRRPFVITSDLGLLHEFAHVGITEYVTCIDKTTGQLLPEFDSVRMKGGTPEIGELMDTPAYRDVDSIVVGWDIGLTARKAVMAINYIKWHEEQHKLEPGYKQLPLIACSGDGAPWTRPGCS